MMALKGKKKIHTVHTQKTVGHTYHKGSQTDFFPGFACTSYLMMEPYA